MRTVVRRGLPWAAVAAGLGVLAVGVGLGPRHYAASGLTGTAALGFALLVVGLVAAGWAGFRVLRGTRRRWWLVSGTSRGCAPPPRSVSGGWWRSSTSRSTELPG